MRPDDLSVDEARLYRAVFERSLAIAFLLAPDGSIRHLNSTALALVGRPGETLVGTRFIELPWWLNDGAARERVRAAMDAALGGEASVFDAMIRAADGRELHVDFSCEPLRDVDARIHSVVIEGWNVSRRVRTEQALRASQAIFAGILSIAADAIISIDEQQRIVHFNQGAEHIFGYGPEEAIGLPLDFLLPERFRAAHAAFVEHFGRAGETARRMGHRREIFGLRKNGEEFPAEASISKLDTPDRRLYTVVLRDITDRKRIEQSQRFLATAGGLLTRSLDEEATIQTVVQLPIGALADLCILDLLDDAGRFHRHASEARDAGVASLVRRLTTEFPLTWDSPSRVIDVMRTGEPELVAQLDEEWLAAHAEHDAQLAIARQLRLRSLMILPLVARESVVGTMTLLAIGPGRPFDGADLQVGNELALRAAFAIDNGRLYGAAQRATRARDEVLGVVSHDLRNPISAVAMITRTLLDQLPPERDADRELLENAYRSTEWMQRLIQDLLDVANIEAGKLSIERRPEPVEPMLGRAVAMFERQAAERSITLRAVAPPRLPAVHADAERIVQVIANLLNNALKYTDAGGAVSVEAVSRSQDVVVSVRDTGAGIPAEHLPHLFERYWQARRSSRKRGSGLGLAIARGIVEAHGGRIEANSTLGEGSTFTFTLPVSPED